MLLPWLHLAHAGNALCMPAECTHHLLHQYGDTDLPNSVCRQSAGNLEQGQVINTSTVSHGQPGSPAQVCLTHLCFCLLSSPGLKFHSVFSLYACYHLVNHGTLPRKLKFCLPLQVQTFLQCNRRQSVLLTYGQGHVSSITSMERICFCKLQSTSSGSWL